MCAIGGQFPFRRRAQPYNVVTLDLRKAFDSVSISSIARALRRVSVHPKTINLICEQYKNCRTTISCGKKCTREIKILRGVKQGDPLSPALFNLIIDELLSALENSVHGVKVGDVRVAAVVYADDLLVFGPDVPSTQATLDFISKFLVQRGLSINIQKCTALTTERVPKKMKLFVATQPQFSVDGEYIVQVSVEDRLKYLGRQYNFMGLDKANVQGCKVAPLKPHQKIDILRNYFAPRMMSELQYPGVSMKTLGDCNIALRKCAKKILHLPSAVSNHFLHASCRDGGLGLIDLEMTIPVIIFNRINRLKESPDPLMQAVTHLNPCRKLINRLVKKMGSYTDTKFVKLHHAVGLEHSYSGCGLRQGKYQPASSSWVYNPPRFWSGRDYIRAIKLKGNVLPTASLPYIPADKRRCRTGCDRAESLSHVLQKCSTTTCSRRDRHNRVVKLLKNIGIKAGFSVDVEPCIREDDRERRYPDW